ncbi:MAG: VOC family protein [Geodermatophilaceae bacterium]|nr:VOC family protein [Geodermatophilaceae bacterium]MDQ3456077.1 VOC family protein [Actinomycetota bacterium]
MKVMPIRYVRDVEAAARFYAALGLTVTTRQRGGGWLELTGSAGILALHSSDQGGEAELGLLADEPLEDVVRQLRAAGFEPGPILDEAYGRSLRLTDPDGVELLVNEHDTSLYT